MCTLFASCDGANEPAPQPPAEPLAVHVAPAPQRATAEQLARISRDRLGGDPTTTPQLIDDGTTRRIDTRLPVVIAPPADIGAETITSAADAESDITTITRALPAGTPGALTPCMVDFAQQSGIARMSDQAYTTFTGAGNAHYQHWCNNSSYLVLTWPLNISHYHLIPENNPTTWCSGPMPKMGVKSGGQCLNQVDGKLVPRYATNMGGNSGVRFWVKSAGNVPKNFDLKSIVVKSGSMEIFIAKTSGWWFWTGMGPGYWEFPQGDNIGELRIHESGQNGTVGYDNVQIAVIP